MGIIFLRHAANRFELAHAAVQADRASGKLKRPPVAADYHKRRALLLPEVARYDAILSAATSRHLGAAVDDAMAAIEDSFPPLKGVLPRAYAKLDAKLLEDLMRIFNRESIRTASGDVFGRIYEYFLRQFAMKKAHDDGEFFTPPSLVGLIVNVTEPGLAPPFDPARGVLVADLACGSCGMFVQTSHFVEEHGAQVAQKIVFYGYEKTSTTIQLAKMNLAVHGLEGHIAEANTYYEDPHTLVERCDRLMANPPFNVDKIDATKVKEDKRRLPFGLPGVNPQGRVSNGNYVWISYFYSYLNPQGRAGFVMSAQASSAGGEEKTVRRKLIETGHVDVMVAIRGGFFYTRTVPCELWFLDKNKPACPSPASGSPRPSDGRGVRGEGRTKAPSTTRTTS
jgi:type I restriction enzyme M protein